MSIWNSILVFLNRMFGRKAFARPSPIVSENGRELFLRAFRKRSELAVAKQKAAVSEIDRHETLLAASGRLPDLYEKAVIALLDRYEEQNYTLWGHHIEGLGLGDESAAFLSLLRSYLGNVVGLPCDLVFYAGSRYLEFKKSDITALLDVLNAEANKVANVPSAGPYR